MARGGPPAVGSAPLFVSPGGIPLFPVPLFPQTVPWLVHPPPIAPAPALADPLRAHPLLYSWHARSPHGTRRVDQRRPPGGRTRPLHSRPPAGHADETPGQNGNALRFLPAGRPRGAGAPVRIAGGCGDLSLRSRPAVAHSIRIAPGRGRKNTECIDPVPHTGSCGQPPVRPGQSSRAGAVLQSLPPRAQGPRPLQSRACAGLRTQFLS